jgi:DNA-binding LacI/PurR family transcriptional regulator
VQKDFMPVTIKDIAKKAGVSHATVSRALNGNAAIPESTAVGIRELAQAMGYFPSAAARGLKTNRSQVIGVIVSHIDNPYFGEIVQGIEDALKHTGYSLFIASSHLDPESEKNIIAAFAEHRVDGVIICSVTVGADQAELLKHYGMPIVVINNQSREKYTSSIAHDDLDGARQVTRHLLQLGHRRIAYLGNELAERVNDERLAGFRMELSAAGVREDQSLVLSCGGSEIENGVAGAEQLLQLHPLPTAVFCFNDLMAIGALKVFSDGGITVPGQVSLAGFDNIEYSAFTRPPLTTFDQPKRAIGTQAALMLLEFINSSINGSAEKIARTMQGQLLVRASTAAVNSNGLSTIQSQEGLREVNN